MKIKKVLIPLFVVLSTLSLGACNKEDEDSINDYPRRPYDLMYYFPFAEYIEGLEEPNYFLKSSHNRIQLSGHSVTSFDENEDIARVVHNSDAYYQYKQINKTEFKKTDYYITINCSNFDPLRDSAVIKYYDNGHVSCQVNYTKKKKEYFYTLDEANTKAIFEVVEKDIAKVENGEFKYYDTMKSYCSLESFSKIAEEELAKESDYTDLDICSFETKKINPDFKYDGLFVSNKTYLQAFYNQIKATNHTFKGYASVDYNAIRDAVLYMDYRDDYAWYAYVIEDNSNFSKIDVAILYGDYNDGKYHFLLAQYEVTPEAGKALADLAISPFLRS